VIPRSQRPPPQMRCGYLADTVDLQDTDEHSYMAGRPSCTCCRTARTTGLQVYIVTNMTHVAMLPRSCGRTYRFWLNRCRNLAVASCTVVTCLVCFTLAAAADSPDQQFRYELGLSTGYGGGAGWVRVAIASPLDPLWFSGGIGTWGGGGGGGATEVTTEHLLVGLGVIHFWDGAVDIPNRYMPYISTLLGMLSNSMKWPVSVGIDCGLREEAGTWYLHPTLRLEAARRF
jgi:hypothetical protein